MVNCVVCGREHPDVPEMCSDCWYSGAYLARNLRGVVRVLESATGSTWQAAHTGGGCFWLATPPWTADEAIFAQLVVTAWPDVLSGGDTVNEVEAGGGWLLSAFPDGHDSDNFEHESRTWPDDPQEKGLATEELPVAVIDAVAWLAQQGIEISGPSPSHEG